jgi:hypothetical protein
VPNYDVPANPRFYEVCFIARRHCLRFPLCGDRNQLSREMSRAMSRGSEHFASTRVASRVGSSAFACDEVHPGHHPNRTENPGIGGSIPSLATLIVYDSEECVVCTLPVSPTAFLLRKFSAKLLERRWHHIHE